MRLLELLGIARQYGPRGEYALRHVDLTVDSGEFIAIVGRSGSGKSTLLNILGLLDRPTGGTYTIRGLDASAMPESARDDLRGRTIGFVFQEAHGVPRRSVRRNVEMPLIELGMAVTQRRERTAEVLRVVGLEHRAGAAVDTLSGGERQRMAIARGVVHAPDLLLADEPTGNLDSENAEAIYELLRGLNRSGVTVVVVTHDRELARRADRIVEIRDGVASGVLEPPVPESPVLEPPGKGASYEHSVTVRASRLSRVLDRLADVTGSMLERLGRTVVSITVVAMGVAGIVASLALSTSAAAQIATVFENASLDEVVITSADGFDEAGLLRVAGLSGVVASGAYYPVEPGLVVGRRTEPRPDHAAGSPIRVIGVEQHGLRAMRTSVPRAWMLGDDALNGSIVYLERTAAAALGVRVAGPNVPGPNVSVWLNEYRFTVAGIFDAAGDSQLHAAAIVSPDVVANRLAPGTPALLAIRTEVGMSRPVAEAAPFALDPGSPTDFRANATPDLAAVRAGVDASVSSLLLVVGTVLLLVAAISTAGSLGAAVSARTGEIGLRRALGASRPRVAALFTAEGALIGTYGGLLGAGLGVWATIALSALQGWTPVGPAWLAGAAVGLGLLTGVLASLLPAVRASRIAPAQALRSN